MAVGSRAREALAVVRLRPFDTSTEQGRSRERLRRAALTSAASAGARAVSAITSLVTVKVALGYLGVERYGLWMTITALTGMMVFADLGLGNGVMTAVSQADGRVDRESAHRVVSSGFILLCGIAVILLLLLAIAYPFLPWAALLNASVGRSEAAPAVAALAVCTVVGIPLGVVQKVQMGYQEGFAAHGWAAVGSILSMLGVVLAAQLKSGLPALVLVAGCGPVLAALANWTYYFRRVRPWLAPSFSAVSRGSMTTLARTGLLFFAMQVTLLAGTATDSLFIAHYIGQAAVAEYAVVQRLFMLALVAQLLIAPLWPAFGEAIARSDFEWARRTLRRALKISVFVGVAAGLALIFGARPVIRIWLSSEVVNPSWMLLAGFGAWVFVASVGATLSTFLNSGPLLRKQTIIFTSASILAFALKPVLIIPLGAAGVVWATVTANIGLYLLPGVALALSMFKTDGRYVWAATETTTR